MLHQLVFVTIVVRLTCKHSRFGRLLTLCTRSLGGRVTWSLTLSRLVAQFATVSTILVYVPADALVVVSSAASIAIF